MFIVWVLETYKMTYADYLDTPVWVLELIREKMRIDQKERELQYKRMNKRHG